ncbi:carboxypeptidase-like regulatory domain-containing protein [Algoriphagus sediminis]|uniref:Carboxypeptidase-like regulatory domain-containing protein n=1 Tax=Algoriphagus sediminis TaxID=3057113 RepID=A0ABT7YDI6_9BACT|nr:carboxypeptidase-like regulatory domain-containing protein [Algoriphagus sediminis]MDN3204521.1 carboxypeptidase-like regulatory domain-containing protein [Algoriphagus sediminis]
MSITQLLKTNFLFTVLFLLFTTFMAEAQTYSLKGRILDVDSKDFIRGATVTLRGTAAGVKSNPAGYFELEDLIADRYVLTIRAEGYNFYEQVVNLDEDLDLEEVYLIKIGAEGTGAAIQKTIRTNSAARLLMERPNFIGGNMVYGIPPEPKKLVGDAYIDKKWNNATILLYRDQELLEGFRARYNVISNMFELMEPENNLVSIMPGLRIQNIVWLDSTYKVPRYFVNGMDFKEDGAPISGFFEVLVDGELPLMRRTKVILKESNYNQALMVGERNDQLLKRNVYYYLKEKDVIEVPKKRKKFYELFGEDAEMMEEFVNNNSLSHREPNDLFEIFTFYNSQFPGFVPIITQLVDEN